MSPLWLTAFIDFASAEFDDGLGHWQRLTGWTMSEPRGDRDEFVSLLPPDGDDFVRVQRLEAGRSRIHLDLQVRDVTAATDAAIASGASLVADRGYRVLRSPGGFVFCLVTHESSRRPAATVWPDGHRSIVDQVCLDIPADQWDSETRFWAEVTGWSIRDQGPRHSEFSRLNQPALPVKILLQRLDETGGPVRAHLDWATDHRQAEITRHLEAGSSVVRRFPGWTVMTGPGGVYCITGRHPD